MPNYVTNYVPNYVTNYVPNYEVDPKKDCLSAYSSGKRRPKTIMRRPAAVTSLEVNPKKSSQRVLFRKKRPKTIR